MRAAGLGGSAHCEPARERGMRCRRRSATAARRVAGRGEEGAGLGGPRGAAAAPGGSTGALRQAAARAHLPAAVLGRVIGCPCPAREIEPSIHSWAGRARTAAAPSVPGTRDSANNLGSAFPCGVWARRVAAVHSSGRGLSRARAFQSGVSAQCLGPGEGLLMVKSLGQAWRIAGRCCSWLPNCHFSTVKL